jgi:hypothetical protein
MRAMGRAVRRNRAESPTAVVDQSRKITHSARAVLKTYERSRARAQRTTSRSPRLAPGQLKSCRKRFDARGRAILKDSTSLDALPSRHARELGTRHLDFVQRHDTCARLPRGRAQAASENSVVAMTHSVAQPQQSPDSMTHDSPTYASRSSCQCPYGSTAGTTPFMRQWMRTGTPEERVARTSPIRDWPYSRHSG